MSNSGKKWFGILLALFCLAGLIMSGPAQAGGTIKVGVLNPMTGPYAVVGERTLKGLRFGFDEVNRQGGVLGKKIELVVRDSETNPALCVRLAKRLILRDKVVAIYGPLHGGAAIAVSNEMRRYRKAVQFPWAAVEELVTDYCSKYTWRVGNSCSQKSRGGAILAAESKYLKWATISSDFSYGRSVVNEFTKHFKKLKPEAKIISQLWPKLNEEDYTAYINKIIAAKPEALYVGLFAGDSVKFIKQAKLFGLFDKMKVYFDDVGHQAILEALGNDIPFGHYTGIRYYWRVPDTKMNRDFVKAFRARFKIYPDTFSGEAYCASKVLVKALKKAGSTNVEALIKALGGLSVKCPEGTVTMRAEDHQGMQSVFWGVYTKSNKYPFPIIGNIREIPANQATAPARCGKK